MDLEYIVTENVQRNRAGQVVQIGYEFEETVVIETTSTSGMARQNREKRNRTFNATVTRTQYETLSRRLAKPLPFDEFVGVLRPFITGYYASSELEQAFRTLDRDHSGTIHVSELSSFLPILNETVSAEALNRYIQQVDENFDGNLNYDEFRALVLRGIGRDIICNHV